MSHPSAWIRRLAPLSAGALLLLGATAARPVAAAAESLPESTPKLSLSSRARFT